MKQRAVYSLAIAAAVAAMFAIGTPAHAMVNENGVAAAFENTYVYKTYLKDDSIKTEENDGVVTLTGTVSDESHKTLAQETVASLPGVSRVDNKLETKADVAADNADARIALKIKHALQLNRNVSASKTTVDVKDGVVTLTGEASSMAQKDLIGEYAGDIDGAKKVKNDMTVAAAPKAEERTVGEKIDDASITAQIKFALLTHRSTSAVKTHVKTQNGEVILTGIAKNETEKSLVTKLVNDIKGVTTVKNEMTVEEIKTK